MILYVLDHLDGCAACGVQQVVSVFELASVHSSDAVSAVADERSGAPDGVIPHCAARFEFCPNAIDNGVEAFHAGASFQWQAGRRDGSETSRCI
jgi:hypothetical protein